MARSYKLQLNVYKILKGKGKRLVCVKCGRELKPGDLVVACQNGRKHYHLECYESLWLPL